MFEQSKITRIIYKDRVFPVPNDDRFALRKEFEVWITTNTLEYFDGTDVEILNANKAKIPEEISAMDLKLQLFNLGITDNDIFLDIDSIPESMFSVMEKEKAKIMYKTATRFQRSNGYVNLIATMEGLSQSQVDTIFINGNLR